MQTSAASMQHRVKPPPPKKKIAIHDGFENLIVWCEQSMLTLVHCGTTRKTRVARRGRRRNALIAGPHDQAHCRSETELSSRKIQSQRTMQGSAGKLVTKKTVCAV